MWTGSRLLQDTGLLTSRTIVAIQEELEGNSAGIRSLPGTARRNDRTGGAVYTPPDDETVIRKEKQLIELLIVFLVLALIFGVLGFTGIAAGLMAIARILFFIILVIAVVWLILVLAGINDRY